MSRRAKKQSHEEWNDMQRRLHVEVTLITKDVVTGDLIWNGRRRAQIHLFRHEDLKRTIKLLRSAGIPVEFPDIVRNTKAKKRTR